MYFCRLFGIFTLLLACTYAAVTTTPKVPECRYCTKIYNPVCSKSGETMKTFPNLCEMNRENCESGSNWSKLRDGEC
ncbi:turripeptide Pal9.2 [Nilaparvata lugens]|uniref:turripeptide Pal9.2 n=1 Tax=Nilaparvata lugens TaxID=108931 RepID=UPI000B98D008|nr:turripeptide Pal9.2 [Nilaparvata lugens]